MLERDRAICQMTRLEYNARAKECFIRRWRTRGRMKKWTTRRTHLKLVAPHLIVVGV
jgi:hypothetical protein